MIDATLVTACVVCAGLLARLILNVHRENVSLRKARSRTAAILWNLKRQRDAFAECLRLSGDEYEELHERSVELEGELAEFRREEAIRDAANRAAVQMRFN